MSTVSEIAANVFSAVCIILAGRNNVHTWWTGIVGCVLFGWVFYHAQLYADVTLQVFFVVTGVVGWWNWRNGDAGKELPVKRSGPGLIVSGLGLGILVTAGYAFLLHRFTDAFAPVPDSAVLAFSVLGQLLLMGRRVESWWCWLLVNTISVPLYFARELYVTAALYVVFWVNAAVSIRHWNRLAQGNDTAAMPSAADAPDQPAR